MDGIESLIADFKWEYEDEFDNTIDGEECVEQFIERAIETFEENLRTALIKEMNTIIEDKHCCDCGDLITDENRPGYDTYFGPDSGYCDKCAAANE